MIPVAPLDYKAIDENKFNYNIGNTAAPTSFEMPPFANDFFSNANNALYNGNISAMQTAITDITPGSPTLGEALPQLTTYKYDQLNRLSMMKAYDQTSNGRWANVTASATPTKYQNEFTYDANGNILTQKRYNQQAALEDALNYQYDVDATTGKKRSNKLYHVNDPQSASISTTDIDDQGAFTPAPANHLEEINTTNNYGYDEIGNLIRDDAEEIGDIKWTVYGKIESITRTPTSTKDNLTFAYDASGNRISKTTVKNNPSPTDYPKTTYYLRDAQGNVMAVYEVKHPTSTAQLFLTEHHLYGSSRLGLLNEYLYGTNPNSIFTRTVGRKNYELNNHLSNVLTTISDRKVRHSTDNINVDYYLADVKSTNDYYPFGQELSGRGNTSAGGYRYGFNGKEKDDEAKGGGNSYDFGARIYDPRLGRWLSCDPMANKRSWVSPYNFAQNNPILRIDDDGNMDFDYTVSYRKNADGTKTKVINATAVYYVVNLSKTNHSAGSIMTGTANAGFDTKLSPKTDIGGIKNAKDPRDGKEIRNIEFNLTIETRDLSPDHYNSLPSGANVIFIVDDVTKDNESADAIAWGTNGGQAIIAERNASLSAKTMAHEMGHNFGLDFSSSNPSDPGHSENKSEFMYKDNSSGGMDSPTEVKNAVFDLGLTGYQQEGTYHSGKNNAQQNGRNILQNKSKYGSYDQKSYDKIIKK